MRRKSKSKQAAALTASIQSLDKIRLNINVIANDDFLGSCVGVLISFGRDILGKYTDVKIDNRVLRFHPARVSRL